jgi:enhancing lycopene biosynthesis protein 2
VDTKLETFFLKSHELGKPIGFACIAPAVAAKLFGPAGFKFTIGNDAGTATALKQWGGTHVDCPVDQILIDDSLKIVTSPAYMLAQRISEAHSGISKMVAAVLERT